ncbi:MAG: hypothetical protein CM15mP40_11760 [Alphaproteobacteria bacterium]|nr:MAG: hypothetical protein CM15mP40_11760 [Alphaproteobacteria bacterium]
MVSNFDPHDQEKCFGTGIIPRAFLGPRKKFFKFNTNSGSDPKDLSPIIFCALSKKGPPHWRKKQT